MKNNPIKFMIIFLNFVMLISLLACSSNYNFDNVDLSNSSWNLNNSNFTVLQLDIDDYVKNARSVYLSYSGEFLFVLGRDSENIAQFILKNPWQIDSAEYHQEIDLSFDLGSMNQESVAHGIAFSEPSGEYLFVFNRTEMFQYNLENDWDIGTAKLIRYKDLSEFVSRGHELHFSPNGLMLYIDDREREMIHEFRLLEPWNILTIKHVYSLDISENHQEVRGIFIHPDGSKMWIVDTKQAEIQHYFMGNQWDLSSAKFSHRFKLSDYKNTRSLFWNNDGTMFYITETSHNKIYQFILE